MALPKNRKPLVLRTNRSQIEEAVRIAGTMQTPGVSPEEGAARRPERAAETSEASLRIAKSPTPPAVPSSQPAAPVPHAAPVLPAPHPRPPNVSAARPSKKTGPSASTPWSVSPPALYGESIHTKGKVDQSLIIEDAIIAWLDQRGY